MTPDTEWEKTLDMWIEKDPDALLRHYIQSLKLIIPKALTSRDTYWKERVNRVLIAMSWREENETSEAIRVLAEIRERLVVTNEDNLK